VRPGPRAALFPPFAAPRSSSPLQKKVGAVPQQKKWALKKVGAVPQRVMVDESVTPET
jgi:hypothetical protein